MAWLSVGSWENNSPRHVGRTAPKLGTNEVGDSTKEDANRRHEAAQIEHRHGRGIIAAGEQENADQRANQTAMKGHPAFPDFENLDRVRKVILRIVEQHIAEAAPPGERRGAKK